MSQPPGSSVPNGISEYNSAFEEYSARAAAGEFTPSTTSILPTIPPTDSRAADVPTPQVSRMAPNSATPTPPQTANTTATASPATTHSPYGSLPSTPRVTFSGHLPNLLHPPSLTFHPFPNYQPPPPQEVYVLTPDSITYDSICMRLHQLLSDQLPTWIVPHIVLLSTTLTDRIIQLGRDGTLGPHGLSSVEKDIFMVVGHEGEWCYMALGITAPIAVKVLMRGPSYFLDGRNPLKDEASMELLRKGFKHAATQEWLRANEVIGRGGRR